MISSPITAARLAGSAHGNYRDSQFDMALSAGGPSVITTGRSRSMVDIRRMGPQIGVEVTDVDVKTLDDAGFAPIYQAWLDCNILVVRDQELEIKDFLRYGRRFGPVIPHPSKSTRHPAIPEVTMLGINK